MRFAALFVIGLSSCALLDGLSSNGEDGIIGPPTDAGSSTDGSVSTSNCAQAIRVGNVSQTFVGPFDSCQSRVDIDTTLACGIDFSNSPGLILEFNVEIAGDYSICADSMDSADSTFLLGPGPCAEDAANATQCAAMNVPNCIDAFLVPGTATLYWEPIGSCTTAGFAIERIMTPRDAGPP